MAGARPGISEPPQRLGPVGPRGLHTGHLFGSTGPAKVCQPQSVRAHEPPALDDLDLGHGRQRGPERARARRAAIPRSRVDLAGDMDEGPGHRVGHVVVPIAGMGDRVAPAGASATLQRKKLCRQAR